MTGKDMTHLTNGASNKKEQHYNTYNKIGIQLKWNKKTKKKIPNFGKGGWGTLPKDKVNATAIKTGDGLVVVDIDTKDLTQVDQKLVSMLGEPTVETAKGYHYYFNVKDSTAFITKTEVFKHVDIRSEGGVVFNNYWGGDENISYKVVGDAKSMPKKLNKYLAESMSSGPKNKKTKIIYNNTDKKKMKEILSYITCYDDYNDWFTVGMALKAWDEVEGLKLWDKWSKQSEAWERGACDKKWRTFKKGEVNVGTLYHLASENGYVIEHKPMFRKIDKISVADSEYKASNFNSIAIDQNKSTPLTLLKELGMTKNDYKKIENQKYFINQFLPIGGLFMLAGDSGSGKSWLAFMVTKRVLKNHTDTSCMFIDLDSGATYTKNRVNLLWKEFGEDRFTYISQTKTDSHEVKNALQNLQNVDLKNTIIVIDSLVGITDGNVNESQVIKPYLNIFEGLRNAGATVILIHHTKKALDKDSVPIYAGSYTIKGAMDAQYMVSKENATITCHLSKSRGDYVGRTFNIVNFELMEAQDINYISPEEVAEQKKQIAHEIEDKDIRVLIRRSKGITKTELRDALIKKHAYSTRRATQAINRNIKEEKIEENITTKNKRVLSIDPNKVKV